MSQRPASERFASLPAAPFYFGFALCGFATCLLGPILPVLSAKWPIDDVQSGWLFAAQFAASTCGSVVSSHSPRRSVAVGFAAMATGTAALTFGQYRAALAAFALLGVGLGLAVSATNLIFGTEYPERRGPLLTRVNLCWGVGAVLVPGAVALAVRVDALRIFLLLTSFCALLLFAAFAPLLKRSGDGAVREDSVARGADTAIGPRVFLLFSTVLFLYVGAETAVAGWIATYVHRLNGLSIERASLFVSAFWIAVVAGRGAVVRLLRVMTESVVLLGGLAMAMAGVAVLLFPHSAGAVFAAVVVIGLGCAPVFPLLVARMLARTGRSRHAGWIFAICGAGGAVAPWIVGQVSQSSNDLRGAFLVPLIALGGIAVCVLADGARPHPGSNLPQ